LNKIKDYNLKYDDLGTGRKPLATVNVAGHGLTA